MSSRKAEKRELRCECGVAYKDTSNPLYYVSRGVRLYSDSFVTYHEDDQNDHKVWKLHPDTRLEPDSSSKILQHHKLMRPANTSTLRAALSGRGKDIDMFSFAIVAPHGKVHKPNGQAKVILGWKDSETAIRMYEQFAEAIKGLPSSNGSNSGLQIDPSARQQDSFTSLNNAPLSTSSSVTERTVAPSFKRSDTIASVRQITQELNANHPMAKRWVPYKHSNGLAIYYHESPGEDSLVGGEYMVSAIVRGSPQECLAILMNPLSNTTLLGPASKVEVLSMESESQVLRLELEAGGLPGYLFAPRHTVIRKLMRKEEDGVYTIMFENVDPAEQQRQPEPAQGAGAEQEEHRQPGYFRRPVSAWVKGGYSICRLEDCPSSEPSPETLIHCILHVDLGGLCGRRSWLYPMVKALGVVDAFVDRMLMSVILVRDEVELQRFVVKPFTCFSTTAAVKAAGAERPMVSRTATMFVRKGMDASAEDNAGLSRRTLRKISTLMTRQQSAAAEAAAQVAAEEAAEEAVQDENPHPTGTLRQQYWSELHVRGADAPFKVRGPSYHLDKVKVDAGEPEYTLQSVDLVNLGKPGMQHVARYLPSIRRSTAAFSFVVNLVVPGTPQLNLVITFASDRHPNSLGTPPADGAGWRPFDLLMHRFYNSEDSARNDMFKLIPHIAQGSWLIQQSVGTTPVMLGKKILTTYHATDRYIEVDCDTSSSSAANYITGMVRGATKSLAVDLSFLLEGTCAAELPETLVGAIRFKHLDLATFTNMPIDKEVPMAVAAQGPSRSSSGVNGSGTEDVSASASARVSRHSSSGEVEQRGEEVSAAVRLASQASLPHQHQHSASPLPARAKTQHTIATAPLAPSKHH